MLGTFHLTALYDILRELHFLYDSEKIFSLLLENLTRAVDAEAGAIFESDEARKNLILRASLGPKKNVFEMVAQEIPFPFGKGVCGWAAQYNKPITVDDARGDERFNPQVDTLTGFKTRSILCAPLAAKDDVLGVVELLNKKSSAFNKNDLDLVALIARQSAVALENAKLYSQLSGAKTFGESIVANLTGGFIAIDAAANVSHLNPAAERILKINAAEFKGKPAQESLLRFPVLQKELIHTFATREKKIRQEAPCALTDGSQITLGYSTFLIQDPAGKILGAAAHFQDITSFRR